MTSLRFPALVDAGLILLVVVLDLGLSWDKRSAPPWGMGAVPWLVLAVALPLTIRRSRPMTALATAVMGTVVVALTVPGFVPVFCTWAALYGVAARCDARRAWAGFALSGAVLATMAVAEVLIPSPGPPFRLATIVAAGVVANSAVFGVGRWVRWSVRQRALVAKYAARTAEVAERTRIARDLHDVVAHGISLMVLQAAVAERLSRTDPERARGSMANVVALGQQAVDELRVMVSLLRPENDGGNGRTPPVAPQDRLCDASRLIDAGIRAGLDLRVTHEGTPARLSQAAETAAYRVVQESIANAAKYSDTTRPIAVTFRWSRGALELRVSSVPAPHPSGRALSTGNGLNGMRDRTREVGGSLRISASPGQFVVVADIPAEVPESAALAGADAHPGWFSRVSSHAT